MDDIILHFFSMVPFQAFSAILGHEDDLAFLEEVWSHLQHIRLSEVVDRLDVVHGVDGGILWGDIGHGRRQEA
jgi:hypothetical protein